ncbi:unnamed protein product [Vitrella brassicaformis CCMP3155]|uniref:Uncharacterized protein n=2 Tax=Vitrella brassicaformis TaxID=1169539 RepID=A0A0G4GDT3_VITBC|nr:unnamed protein product [Vitrella brassicaformis CCMP3155]|eukprot:CEM27480.1 unnamed protein product [Vitrella brassicaformis CCMP3155]
MATAEEPADIPHQEDATHSQDGSADSPSHQANGQHPHHAETDEFQKFETSEKGEAENEILSAWMCEEDSLYAELTQVRDQGWQDEQFGAVWDRRKQIFSNRDIRGRGATGHFDHVASYYDSYRVGMPNLAFYEPKETRELPRNACVLEFGAAPGGAVKFWCEDCRAKVTGITLPPHMHGMQMVYRNKQSINLLWDDLSTEDAFERLKPVIQRSLEEHRAGGGRHHHGRGGDVPLFDVVHHGAIIHRGQQDVVTKEDDQQRNYRMRLTRNVYRLALTFLREGGHMLLVMTLRYQDLLMLSLFLPLFEDFQVFRTSFRVNSRFRILLKYHRPFAKDRKQWGPRKVFQFFQTMTADFDATWGSHPDRFNLEVAMDVFRQLRPKMKDLWQDQLDFLKWLQRKARKAKCDQDITDLALLLVGGAASGIDFSVHDDDSNEEGGEGGRAAASEEHADQRDSDEAGAGGQ